MIASGFDFPDVTDELLSIIVREVVASGSPRKIILFGSRARGDFRRDSDLDLLIIEESDLPRFKRSPKYYCALKGLFPAKDIVVWTPREAEEWSEVPNAFITTILSEGRVLYEE